MAYTKVIRYGNVVELYNYENDLRYNGRRGRRPDLDDEVKGVDFVGKGGVLPRKQKRPKRADNARRSSLAFARLIRANLAVGDNPLLFSLTFREEVKALGEARKCFNAFARRMQGYFGKQVRFVCVPEFQDKYGRGAVHFHALYWGICGSDAERISFAKAERRTRLVAGLWGYGFVDVVATDGNERLAGYLAKYMAKAFMDERLSGCRAYSCSQNLKRPLIDKNCSLLPYFTADLLDYPDLSTVSPLTDKTYMTKWLGKGRFRLFELNNIRYEI